MNKTTLFTASAIIAGAAITFGATSYFFAQAATTADTAFTFEKGMMGFKPRMMMKFDSNLEAALSAKDYAAFKEALPADSPLADVVTEENFSKFAEAHALMKDGKFEEAKALHEELGLPLPDGKMHRGIGFMHSPELIAAIEANDYNAFKEALPEGVPFQDKITAENFSKLVEAYKLAKEGKLDEAKAIYEELGFPGIGGMKHFAVKVGSPEMLKAIESKDYQSFIANAPKDSAFAKLTEEQFNKLVQAYALAKEGKLEEAKAIYDELGLTKPEAGVRMEMKKGNGNNVMFKFGRSQQ